MTERNCRVCDTGLVVDKNITQCRIGKSDYICRNCRREYNRQQSMKRRHRTGQQQPMSENIECSSFLGVHVAERVLGHVFKDVAKMPYGTPGFDFRCQHGYLVDVKSSCRHCYPEGYADRWLFAIRRNPIADYFLCLAFDNRNDLNPEHVWLVPGCTINDRMSVSISETKLDKWMQYEHPLGKIIACCNVLKGGL